MTSFLQKAGLQCKRIFTGHNDEILDANAYLTALQHALQHAIENGEQSLQPSLRSAQESFGSGSATIAGDWRIDPILAGANVKFLYDSDATQNPPHYVIGFDPTIRSSL